MMRKVIFFIKKEFLHLFRDKRTRFAIIIPPLIQLIILGYAANLDIEKLNIGVCDFDGSKLSNQVIEKFTSSTYFDLKVYSRNLSEMEEAIARDIIDCYLYIPQDFENNIKKYQNVQILLVVDGSESLKATSSVNFTKLILSDFEIQNILKIKEKKINPSVITLFNPDLKSRNFMVPGVLSLIILIITMLLTAGAIVREKEEGTIEQLNVVPINKIHIILGKLLPYVLVSTFEIIITIFLALSIFHVPFRGNLLTFLFFALIFILTTSGFGIAVSNISATQHQAIISTIFFFMLPMIFLSGFIFPIENMPLVLQFITNFIPLKYFFIIIRGIFLKGLGFRELWISGAKMFVIGIIILIFSVMKYKKTID